MLNARLFAGLAAITFAIAILGRLRVLPGNLNFSVGTSRHQHLGFGPLYWQLFICLVCAFFALAYFGTVRLMQRPPNLATGLIGFLLVTLASVVWLISSFLMKDTSRSGDRLAIYLFATMACFIVGVASSTANVVWALLRSLLLKRTTPD
jgi:hypothetical protein